MIRNLLTIFLFLVLQSCNQQAANHFSDPVLVRIANLQDRRGTDSLLLFLNSPQANYRLAAGIALASVQDTMASPYLGNLLLEDKDSEVRRAAAFALGQTGGHAAVNALIPALQDEDSTVVRESLEALGKVVTRKDLTLLRQFVDRNQLESEGLTWGYLRAGLRGQTDSAIYSKLAKFLTNGYNVSTRQAAALYFSRVKPLSAKIPPQLLAAAEDDSSAAVRMAAVAALRYWKNDEARDILKSMSVSDHDERVRVNAVRSLSLLGGRDAAASVLNAVRDSSQMVQIAASEAILRMAREVDQTRLDQLIRSVKRGRTLSNLYALKLEMDSTHETIKSMEQQFQKSSDYDKGWLMQALGHAKGKDKLPAFEWLVREIAQQNAATIRTHAAEALIELNHSNEFFQSHREQVAITYRKIIGNGDPATIGIISTALLDSNLSFRSLYPDVTFLKTAAAKLQLPKDIESLQPLNEAIAWLEGKPRPPLLKNGFNHPIDWNLVRLISADQRALVKTSKGEIVFQLFVEEAPGSVANFVDLVKNHYFDGRYFHRVVPNFVIQTGCNRGDGYGSEEYSIRSEFSTRKYATGAVGMASAGKDTEGTQWFITHSPTPHLDGRYTLFAEVVSGQKTVDKIEVGDKIETVILISP